MNINGPISIWYGRTDYTPGMELGKPDRIVEPGTLVVAGPFHPTIVTENSIKRTRKNRKTAKKPTLEAMQ